MHPGGANAGEEVANVEAQHNGLTAMTRRMLAHRASAHEAEGRFVHRHMRQKPVEHAPLRRFQPLFRRFEQTVAATRLRQHQKAVVLMPQAGFPAALRASGEPIEFGRVQPQPGGQVCGCRRIRPAAFVQPERRRMQRRRAQQVAAQFRRHRPLAEQVVECRLAVQMRGQRFDIETRPACGGNLEHCPRQRHDGRRAFAERGAQPLHAAVGVARAGEQGLREAERQVMSIVVRHERRGAHPNLPVMREQARTAVRCGSRAGKIKHKNGCGVAPQHGSLGPCGWRRPSYP